MLNYTQSNCHLYVFHADLILPKYGNQRQEWTCYWFQWDSDIYIMHNNSLFPLLHKHKLLPSFHSGDFMTIWANTLNSTQVPKRTELQLLFSQVLDRSELKPLREFFKSNWTGDFSKLLQIYPEVGDQSETLGPHWDSARTNSPKIKRNQKRFCLQVSCAPEAPSSRKSPKTGEASQQLQ